MAYLPLRTDTSKCRDILQHFKEFPTLPIMLQNKTLKYKQHSTAENPGRMFNKPSSFMKQGNSIRSVDYLL